MRVTAFGILFLMFSLLTTAAFAGGSYLCKSDYPKGTAAVVEGVDAHGLRSIQISFHNEERNQTYTGELYARNLRIPGYFIAEGDVLAYEQNSSIKVTLVGTFYPEDGNIMLQLLGHGDTRIDNGYGNRLYCKKSE